MPYRITRSGAVLAACSAVAISGFAVAVPSFRSSATSQVTRRHALGATREQARKAYHLAEQLGELNRYHRAREAGINGATGDAVAKLIAALEQTDGAVIVVGSIFLVKDEGSIFVRELTSREMTHWKRNPALFRDPRAALTELQRAGEEADWPTSISPEEPETDGRRAQPPA
jgi:hypothetical protein